MLAAAVEAGLFCTLRTKRCHRIQLLSLSVTAALAAIYSMCPAMMVALAPSMAWWQISVRVVPQGTKLVYLAGQAVPGMRVVLHFPIWVEAAVALEDKGAKVVAAARALNRPYLVPPVIMAVAVVAAPKAPLARGDWVAVGQADFPVIQVQPSQGVVAAAVDIWLTGVQAAPASSSSATRTKVQAAPAPSRRRARRVST